MPAERGYERVDLLARRFGREAHAQHARGGFFVELHRSIDMAELSAVAGAARRDADALPAEVSDDIRARVADERDGEDMRRSAVSDAHHAVDGEQLVECVLLERRHVRELGLIVLQPQLDRAGKARDLRRGLSAGAQAALLSAAREQGTHRAAARADVERADALGRVELVPAEGDEVGAERVCAEGDLQKSLYCIGVQQCLRAALAQERGDLCDRKDTAGLVVHKHHGHERRILAQRVRDLLRCDIAVSVRREAGDGIALLLELAAWLKHRAVLHRGGDDVPPHMAVLVRGEANGPVVALRAAGGEEKLLGLAAERGGDGRAVRVQPLFCGGAVGILRAGVAAAVQ